MEKIDFKRKLKSLYSPSSRDIVIVNVPPMNFLMINGKGDPNTSKSYKDAVETLFSVSYALKFMVKKTNTTDYSVMPLEGLWWMDDITKFSIDRKDDWKWKMMIMQPGYVTAELVPEAIEQTQKKKDLTALPLLEFDKFDEGRSIQIMHIGQYSEEMTTIASMREFMKENHLAANGHHHEIYLSDPRRAAPEKLKTILRQPIRESQKISAITLT